MPRKHLDISTLIRATLPQQPWFCDKTEAVGVKSVKGLREAAYCLPTDSIHSKLLKLQAAQHGSQYSLLSLALFTACPYWSM